MQRITLLLALFAMPLAAQSEAVTVSISLGEKAEAVEAWDGPQVHFLVVLWVV